MSLSGVRLNLVTSLDEAMAFKRWVGERHENNALALDLETTGLDPRDPGAAIRLFQLGDTRCGWALDWQNWRGVALEVMRAWDGQTIYHNMSFEYKWLRSHSPWYPARHRSIDTMLGAHIIDPLGRGALKSLATKYVDSRAAIGQSLLDNQMAVNGWNWTTVPTDFEPYWCVPLDTQILTRNGWRRHDQVRPGDETLGYDHGELVWNRVKRVETFAQAPLVAIGNSGWSTECTPNHRWVFRNLSTGGTGLEKLNLLAPRPEAELVLSGDYCGPDPATSLSSQDAGKHARALPEDWTPDAQVQFMLGLSPHARLTWLMAVQDTAAAEQAVELGMFFEQADSRPRIMASDPVRPVGDAAVWCPTTELHTWVARDRHGRIFLTGNTYGALDTVLTAQLWDQFRKQLDTGMAYGPVFDLEMAVRFIVSGMEFRGAQVDLPYAVSKRDQLLAYLEHVVDWGKRVYGISLTSVGQVASKIDELGAGHVLGTTTTGRPQADKAVLKLLANPDNEFSGELQLLAQQVLYARRAQKFASTYFDSIVRNEHNGRVHADIRTLAARTARMSISTFPAQQLPKGDPLVRTAIIPSPGNVLVTCDSDQIEARIMANFSEDTGLRDAFYAADHKDGDFFVEVAKAVYADPRFVKSDKRRNMIKSTVYGLLYGAGVPTMAETAGVTVEKMRPVVDALHAAYPGIREFISSIEHVATQRRRDEGQAYVLTPIGRRLPADPGREFALVNYVIQSTAADVLKRSLVRLDAAGWADYSVFPVHDEVVFDIPEEYAEQAINEIPELMTERGGMVPLTASAEGPFLSWGEKYQ